MCSARGALRSSDSLGQSAHPNDTYSGRRYVRNPLPETQERGERTMGVVAENVLLVRRQRRFLLTTAATSASVFLSHLARGEEKERTWTKLTG